MIARLEIAALIFLAVLAALVGLYAYAERQGRQAAELNQRRRRQKAIDRAETVEDEINAMPDADIRDRLRGWARG